MAIDLSKVTKPQIKKVDEDTAIKYKVVSEKIDLKALRQEKAELEEQLNMKEPSKEELIELGKSQHPYYWDKTDIENRIKQIDDILKG